MKTLKLFTYLFALLIINQVTWAQNPFVSKVGGGGNGQLVVIPLGVDGLVPYEIAKIKDSATYRNFFELPFMEGVYEPREILNKKYALHAMKWLELIKKNSNGLYEDLMKAAKTTRFRYVDGHLVGEIEKYPEGEIDYKTYQIAGIYHKPTHNEKAEIGISITVMEKLVGITDFITKEENQGFVLIHELINAAYPDWKIERKLALGEIIANLKVLRWTRSQFLAELADRNMEQWKRESFAIKMAMIEEIGIDNLPNISQEDVQLLKKLYYSQDLVEALKDIMHDINKFTNQSNKKIYWRENAYNTLRYHLEVLATAFGPIDAQRRLELPHTHPESVMNLLDEEFHFQWNYVYPKWDKLDVYYRANLNEFLRTKRKSIIEKTLNEILETLEEKSYKELFSLDKEEAERVICQLANQYGINRYFMNHNTCNRNEPLALASEQIRDKAIITLNQRLKNDGYDNYNINLKFDKVKKHSLFKLLSCDKDLYSIGVRAGETYKAIRAMKSHYSAYRSGKAIIKVLQSEEASRIGKKIKIPRVYRFLSCEALIKN